MIWIFIKIFIWFKGGYLNSFFCGGLLFKSFMTNISWVLLNIYFGLEDFSFSVDSTQIFYLGKFFEILSFKNNPMTYGLILPHSKIFLPWPRLKIFFQNPSLHFGSSQISNPSKFYPFLIFVLFILPSKQFLSFILDLGDLQRNHQIPFEFWFQTNSSN